MKKYLFLIALTIISLTSFNLAYAGPEDDACRDKKNGDACTYTTQTNTTTGPSTQTNNGYCDRRGTVNDTIFGGGSLYCNKDANGWKDCAFPGDACELDGKLGVCPSDTSREQGTCDTTKTPTGNPGGSTPPTCDGKTCPSNEVCVNQGGEPTCTANAATSDGKCDGKTCPSNEVCVNQGGEPTCTANAATPGNTADNGTTTDASSPQTVSFPNPSRFTSITALIAGIINALLGVLGAITVAVLVASGFKYMTSSNPGEVGQALEGIRNAIVGLMIIMGAFLITQYVITALAV